MKIKTVKRLLKLAEQNSPVLVGLCKQWRPQPRKDKEPVVDPVSCIKEFNRQRMITLFMGTPLYSFAGGFGGFLFGAIMNGLFFRPPSEMITYTSIISVGVGMWLGAMYCIMSCYPERTSNQKGLCWEINNAIYFVEAIEIAERFLGCRIDDWHSADIPFKDSGILLRAYLDLSLRDKAEQVDELGGIPWKGAEHDAELEKWKETHALLRKLCPSLSPIYADYFPKSTLMTLSPVDDTKEPVSSK
jgi:hypothetical protein